MRKTALMLLLAGATPALAGGPSPSGAGIDCYCTDRSGARVELGEVICLEVDGRAFLARCEMSLNNPMWRDLREGCVTSRLERLRGRRMSVARG